MPTARRTKTAPALAINNTPRQDLALIASDYPQSWEEMIGQDLAKRQLKIGARSAKARGIPMDHVLIESGMPGVGKTTLALLTARELGGDIKIESGQIKPAQVPLMFADLKDGDVLFIDEIHRLVQGGRHNAEWLLHYLQDGVMFGPLGIERAPKVTVIGATTDAGRLPDPIRHRFPITPTIVPYSDEEGTLITLQLSKKILESVGLASPTEAVASQIATAANNSPRHMRRVLVALRDLALADEIHHFAGEYDLEEALDFAGVSADGLPIEAQNYLVVLLTEFKGAPAGQKTLAEAVGLVGGAVTEVERILLDKGFIARTKSGRQLTTDGIRRARELEAA